MKEENEKDLTQEQKERYLRELQDKYGETERLNEILPYEILSEKQKKRYLVQLSKKYGGALRLKEIMICEIPTKV